MLTIPAILTTHSSLKDKTLKLVFHTNEPTPQQFLDIATSTQQFGYLAFKKDSFKQAQIDALNDLESDYEDKGKTPAKRLRGILYIHYTNNDKGFKSFSNYYDAEMEKIITHFKNKIDG